MSLTTLLPKILELDTEEGIVYPIDEDTYRVYSKKNILSISHNNKTYTVGGKISMRFREDKHNYTTQKSGTIKTITLDEKYDTFVISIKETEKIHYDVMAELEVVAIVADKLVHHGDKLYGVHHREKNRYDEFKVDCEITYSYYRFFDTTKDKNDFYVFWTIGEAKQFILENAVCLNYLDIMVEFNELLKESGLDDNIITDLKKSFDEKIIKYPLKKCDILNKP